MVVLWVHHLILLEIFLIWEKLKHVQLKEMFEFVQKLCSLVILLDLRGLWWKSTVSHLVWEILNVFMHYLPDQKLRHSHDPGYGSDWLTGIVINHNLISATNLGFSYQNDYSEASELLYLHNQIWTYPSLLSCCTFIINIGLIHLFWAAVPS